MRIIDTTFAPADGPNHCHEAYHNDAGEIFDNPITNFFIALAAVIIILSCIPIFFVLYFLSAVRIVKKKTIDRKENLHKRLDRTDMILKSTIEELNEHGTNFDKDGLKDSLDELNVKIEQIKNSLNLP